MFKIGSGTSVKEVEITQCKLCSVTSTSSQNPEPTVYCFFQINPKLKRSTFSEVLYVIEIWSKANPCIGFYILNLNKFLKIIELELIN